MSVVWLVLSSSHTSTDLETSFSDAEKFAKKKKQQKWSMQLIDFGNAGSHLYSGWSQNQGWRERTALLLDSSAVTVHHSTNSLQHSSQTSGECRTSQVEADPPADNGLDQICWRLQAWHCQVRPLVTHISCSTLLRYRHHINWTLQHLLKL